MLQEQDGGSFVHMLGRGMGAWLGLLCLAACSSSGGSQSFDAAAACEAGRPSDLGACFEGDDFADCDGTAEPAFACRSNGEDCRWFVGGCAPETFVVSACPPDDVCCRGGWPFPHDTFASEDFPHGDFDVVSQLVRLGPLPWDAERGARIEVELDATVEPVSPPSAECVETPEEPYYYFCEEGIVRLRGATARDDDLQPDDTVSMSIETASGLGSNGISVEVLPDGTGGHVARACVHRVTDTGDGEPACPASFEDVDPATADPARDCAVDGFVRLSDIPERGESIEDMAGRLELTFADGLRVEGGF